MQLPSRRRRLDVFEQMVKLDNPGRREHHQPNAPARMTNITDSSQLQADFELEGRGCSLDRQGTACGTAACPRPRSIQRSSQVNGGNLTNARPHVVVGMEMEQWLLLMVRAGSRLMVNRSRDDSTAG